MDTRFSAIRLNRVDLPTFGGRLWLRSVLPSNDPSLHGFQFPLRIGMPYVFHFCNQSLPIIHQSLRRPAAGCDDFNVPSCGCSTENRRLRLHRQARPQARATLISSRYNDIIFSRPAMIDFAPCPSRFGPGLISISAGFFRFNETRAVPPAE